MKKFQVRHYLILLVFCVICLFGIRAKVSAAGIKELKEDKTYTVKLTDNKKCKIRYTQKGRNGIKEFSLYVNEKLAEHIKGDNAYYKVSLANISSKRTLICIDARYTDKSGYDRQRFFNIYEYVNGTMNLLTDLCALTRSDTEWVSSFVTPCAKATLFSASHNKFVVSWYDYTNTTGVFGMNLTYDVFENVIQEKNIDGDIRAVSLKENRFSKENPRWTASTDMITYADMSLTQTAFLIKKGEIVRLKTVRTYNGKRLILLMNRSGKGGWVLADKKYPNVTFPFKEAIDDIMN